ncbi:alcohol dehydrogenase catalytic domain-containing protein [Chitinophaga agrisoli]|uniref:Alcohol dehydrogenase catalytic domain-containing protein n=1 Tax=Chitinophaga agrisoli TaxID=2607653 RepID=A0A5B2VJU3_9BACT|nr:alcohol dehydrogenase catalytic domain-containing protein [Chitinophaga agrisoli]KAA2239371.1 alcohol dehydrogenase catalytic domain-containing protein [Chitinophaga agrisoli]
MKIKAYAVMEKGGKLTPFCYEKALGKNDALVRITHCSIARGDIQFMNDDWGDTKFPVVPGHEIVGIVEDIGANVTGLQPGDRVGIGYQQTACFKCEFCRAGNEQFCPDQQVIGVHCHGGLAEHIITDSRFVFKLPASLDAARSAPLMSSGVTVYTAIRKANLPDNAVTGVLGAGGLGLLAARFLQKMGHQVSAFSHSPGKKQLIEQSGAAYLDSSNESNLSSLQQKFDFILSTLNVDFNINTYLKLLKPQGKFGVVASPLQQQPISIGLLYDYAQRTIYGNYVGSRKDMVDTLDFSARNNMECMVEVLPFSEMDTAIATLRNQHTPVRLVLEHR